MRENRTPAEMLDALDAPRGALVVMDRGIATEERVCWLREQGYRYLVVSREHARHFDAEHSVCIRTAANRNVHLQKVVSDDGREARLYCFSEERAAKERAIVERFAGRFEQALTELSEGLARPRVRKRVDRVRERIGRIRARSRGLARHYVITVDTDPTGQHAVSPSASPDDRGRGRWSPPSGCVLPAHQPNRLERGRPVAHPHHPDRHRGGLPFPESELGLRPIYHHKPVRAEGHLFITVIAYQLVQVIRTRLRVAGHGDGWAALRRILEGQQRVTAVFRREDGRTPHVRKATRPRSAPNGHLRRLGHQSRTRRNPKDRRLNTHPKRTDVVPLDDPWHRNFMIYISIF